MSDPARSLDLVSVEEFLESRGPNAQKAELVGGVIQLMAGAKIRHVRICTNAVLALGPASRENGCELLSSDAALQVARDTIYYPDVMVVCDAEGDSDLVRTKPCLVIEVLSPSTRAIDEREKRVAYLRIPSMQDYLIVHPEDRMVDHHHREDGELWSWTVRNPGDVCPTTCLGPLPVADLFLGL